MTNERISEEFIDDVEVAVTPNLIPEAIGEIEQRLGIHPLNVEHSHRTRPVARELPGRRGATGSRMVAPVGAQVVSAGWMGATTVAKAAKPQLLSGDNPQIPKGEGDAPVQSYITATPGWKGDVVRQLDTLIVRTVPEVHKAVKWNTPFYGIHGEGWFVAFHCMTKYVKITFFRGTSLDPVPPEPSKIPETRYFHIREHDAFPDTQLTSWIRQASRLPGEVL
jgi:hypothetical protein